MGITGAHVQCRRHSACPQLVIFALLVTTPGLVYGADAIVDSTGMAITDLAKTMLGYAAVLAAAGTVSMALVELLKAVADVRRLFHQHFLNRWLDGERERVKPELLYLAIGDRAHERVLCGQPLEKMMGQLQAAARLALDYPEKFEDLYAFLTATDIPADAKDAEAPDETRTRSTLDRDLWKSHAVGLRAPQLSKSSVPTASDQPTQGDNLGVSASVVPTQQRAMSDAAQARARLASLVARKLDGFQLRTQYWWDRSNQTMGLVVGIGVVWYALGAATDGHPWERISLGVIGGLLAPFAKDFSKSLAHFSGQ